MLLCSVGKPLLGFSLPALKQSLVFSDAGAFLSLFTNGISHERGDSERLPECFGLRFKSEFQMALKSHCKPNRSQENPYEITQL